MTRTDEVPMKHETVSIQTSVAWTAGTALLANGQYFGTASGGRMLRKLRAFPNL